MKNNSKTIARLKQIAESRGAVSVADKQYLRAMSDKMGIAFNERQSCMDCYVEQAVVLLRKLSEEELLKDKTRQYILRTGIDVIWKGHRINATCSDEQLAEFVANGFSKTFFLRLPS